MHHLETLFFLFSLRKATGIDLEPSSTRVYCAVVSSSFAGWDSQAQERSVE
ncbi:hypothetical protein [Desulfocurvibacter africanus]|uniref:hypothetical protein n=1 Tax=Desulfocurvibacter africanus TaxID=873 RepID=UPI00187C9BE0|nr:hypothetical protein [Desulfocurvibacter africanus]